MKLTATRAGHMKAASNVAPWLNASWALLTDELMTHASAPVCVAFSGGSDSLALLHLAEAWGRRAGRPIVALTVNHRLNPQSADWTAAAGAAATRLGVRWLELVWSSDKPTQGLPAAARAARHALLAGAARDLSGRVVLMGHTADDVAESALIRTDTPGHGRLRPWSPSPAWPEGRGVFLLRPLLAARRTDLRAWLSDQGLHWLEDPANADPRFARSRARAYLANGEWGDEDLSISDGDASVRRLAGEATVTVDGRLVVSRKALAGAPLDAVRRVVSAALVCVGGGDRPPRGDSLIRLIDAIASGDGIASTLSGARIVGVDADYAIMFGRDAGERLRGGLEALALEPGEAGVFDGRFEVRAQSSAVQICALCGLIAQLDRADRLRLRVIPAWARGAFPAVVDANGLVRLPAPFGDGPAVARALVGQRFAAACGLVRGEVELATSLGMAL